MFNAKVCHLMNTATSRFHPIIFSEAPAPSDHGGPSHRFKSRFHHTIGFDTREESEAECRRLAASEHILGEFIDAVFEWDGEGVPATVAFF